MKDESSLSNKNDRNIIYMASSGIQVRRIEKYFRFNREFHTDSDEILDYNDKRKNKFLFTHRLVAFH